MSLGNMVPGSEVDPDWRAVVVGAALLGALCLVPVLDGWLQLPTGAAAEQEGPSILETGLPLVVGAPGTFLAGYLARTENLAGAVEGMLSVPLGGCIPVVGAMANQFLLFEGAGVGWQIEMVWRGVGFWAVLAVPFVPLACVFGGVLGWLGALASDAVGGGVRISWS